jgi:hypothetical protein
MCACDAFFCTGALVLLFLLLNTITHSSPACSRNFFTIMQLKVQGECNTSLPYQTFYEDFLDPIWYYRNHNTV